MLINVNGLDLFYEVTGEGAPLVMLHGNGETHKIFDRAVPLLAPRFTVYRPDTRGHGQSAPVSEYHYDDMAEDVRLFIEKLALPAPVLYGFSDGGIVGLLLASRYPKLLSRLIVSGANLNPGGLSLNWLSTIRYKLTHNPRIRLMLTEPDITPEMLQRIEIPVTVLAGSRDIIKRSQTEAIAQNIKNSALTILPGETHDSYVAHNEKIGRIISEELTINNS